MAGIRKFNWVLFLVVLAIVFLVFQGIFLLIARPEAIYESIAAEPKLARLMDKQDISEAQVLGVLRFIAFFWLALSAWLGLALMNIKAKGKRTFIHLLIPSILAFISGRWEAGIFGLVASMLYRRTEEHKNIRT